MSHVTDAEAREISLETAKTEAEKANRQAERLERKARKEEQAKKATLEKFVAPAILILTIVVALLLRYLATH
jgi:hypothetical protein